MTIWIGAFWAQGALLSWVFAGGDRQHSPRQYALSLGVFMLTLMVASASAFGISLTLGSEGLSGGVPGVLHASFVIAVGVVIHAPFLSRALGELVISAADEATGRTGAPMKATHDQATAAMRSKEWIKAANLLNAAIAQDPGDVEARRLRAEVHHSCGELARAVTQLEAAYAAAIEPGTKGALGLRAAEIELSSAPPGKHKARAWLARVRSDLAGTPFERYAIERLKVLD